MHNCHCSVGKTFNKCGNVVHIQALDYRAATFEALQQLERAKKDAEWILELAPRFPDVRYLIYQSNPILTNFELGILAPWEDCQVNEEQ